MAHKTGEDMVREAKGRIREVTAAEVKAMVGRGERAVLLDVRDAHEFNVGRLPGAIHLSRGNLETKVEKLVERGAKVVIYCATGQRSALAADTLQAMGYTDVASMAGGIRDWAQAGGAIEG